MPPKPKPKISAKNLQKESWNLFAAKQEAQMVDLWDQKMKLVGQSTRSTKYQFSISKGSDFDLHSKMKRLLSSQTKSSNSYMIQSFVENMRRCEEIDNRLCDMAEKTMNTFQEQHQFREEGYQEVTARFEYLSEIAKMLPVSAETTQNKAPKRKWNSETQEGEI